MILAECGVFMDCDYRLVDNVKLGSSSKSALCDVHRNGLDSRRDFAMICWLGGYSDIRRVRF